MIPERKDTASSAQTVLKFLNIRKPCCATGRNQLAPLGMPLAKLTLKREQRPEL
jgi:hypothetical protein